MRKMFTHAQPHVKIMPSAEGPSSSSGTRSVELLPLEGAISKVWSHFEFPVSTGKIIKDRKAESMFVVDFVRKF